LTEAVRRKPYSVVLLDEIEKAHPDVFNILLQVLDDGRLTDNKGRTVDFKNTIIIMTSNMGSHLIMERMGEINNGNRDDIIDKTKDDVKELLKNSLPPEFLNRIDETTIFSPLTKDEIKSVVVLQFDGIRKMLCERNISIDLSDEAASKIAELGYEPQFGARPVKRVIQKTVLNELSKKILKGDVVKNQDILVDCIDDEIVFVNK